MPDEFPTEPIRIPLPGGVFLNVPNTEEARKVFTEHVAGWRYVYDPGGVPCISDHSGTASESTSDAIDVSTVWHDPQWQLRIVGTVVALWLKLAEKMCPEHEVCVWCGAGCEHERDCLNTQSFRMERNYMLTNVAPAIAWLADPIPEDETSEPE